MVQSNLSLGKRVKEENEEMTRERNRKKKLIT